MVWTANNPGHCVPFLIEDTQVIVQFKANSEADFLNDVNN